MLSWKFNTDNTNVILLMICLKQLVISTTFKVFLILGTFLRRSSDSKDLLSSSLPLTSSIVILTSHPLRVLGKREAAAKGDSRVFLSDLLAFHRENKFSVPLSCVLSYTRETWKTNNSTHKYLIYIRHKIQLYINS